MEACSKEHWPPTNANRDSRGRRKEKKITRTSKVSESQSRVNNFGFFYLAFLSISLIN